MPYDSFSGEQWIFLIEWHCNLEVESELIMIKKLLWKQRLLWGCTGLIAMGIIGALAGCPASDNPTPVRDENKSASQSQPDREFKILHVMSYHSPWKWTDDQLKGFQSALQDLKVEYKIMQMDTKRRSDEAWIRQITADIKETIDTWKPDLVYTNDDNVQIYVCKDYINSGIPLVFSAVNADPSEYGFDKAKNITGILERMHYVGTVNLLKKLKPDVKKVMMLSDNGKMWPPMLERMKKQMASVDSVEVVGYELIDNYDAFRQKVLDCQNSVDAIGFFGIFEFKDETGANVPMETVISWLAEHSHLPDFSFWKDRVEKGTLCSMAVSGEAQGYQAGLLAHRILAEGLAPSDLPMKSTEEGIPLINLQTAERLKIKPDAETLLSAEVIRHSTLP